MRAHHQAIPLSRLAAFCRCPSAQLIGRVVNALGEPIDGKGPINAKLTLSKGCAGRYPRKSVSQPVQTGLSPLTRWCQWDVVNAS